MTDLLSRYRLRSKYFATKFALPTDTADYDVGANSHLFKSENRPSPNFDPTFGSDDGTRYNIRLESDGDDFWVKFNSTSNDPIFVSGSIPYEEFNINVRSIFLTAAALTTAQVDRVVTTAEDGVKNVDTFTLLAATEINTFTLPSLANATDRDYLVITTTDGISFAIYLDKTGSSAAPTGATYVAVASAHKAKANISGATTASDVATIVAAAFQGLTDRAANFAAVASTATVVVTHVKRGPASDAQVLSLSDGAADSDLTIAQTRSAGASGDYIVTYDTDGHAWAVYTDYTGSDAAPTGAIYAAIPAARKSSADCSAASTATTVCDAFRTALNALTGWSTKFTSSGTTTLVSTNDQIGPVTNAVCKSASDGTSQSAVAQTTAGVVSTLNDTYFKLYPRASLSHVETVYGVWLNTNSEGVQPTDSDVDIWVPVAIALGTTNTNVAVAIKNALNAISGTPFSAANTTNTLDITHSVAGPRHAAVNGGTPFTLSVQTAGEGDAANIQILVR